MSDAPALTVELMARQIADALEDSGLTQAELARRSGMTEKHVSRVLNCQNTANPATLDYWAFLLGRRFVVTLAAGGASPEGADHAD